MRPKPAGEAALEPKALRRATELPVPQAAVGCAVSPAGRWQVALRIRYLKPCGDATFKSFFLEGLSGPQKASLRPLCRQILGSGGLTSHNALQELPDPFRDLGRLFRGLSGPSHTSLQGLKGPLGGPFQGASQGLPGQNPTLLYRSTTSSQGFALKQNIRPSPLAGPSPSVQDLIRGL